MRKYVSEAIGTFAIVFCCTGAGIINQEIPGSVTQVGIAMTCGLIVASMIYALGEISGAHFNPAVTLSFWASKHFPLREVMPYITSQLIGAFLASILLKILFPLNIKLGATLPHGSYSQSFIFEFILTFILMLVLLNVAKGTKEQGLFAGIAIGSIVLLEVMFAGPISGASMNPARSIAPAVVTGNADALYIYIFAPIFGALSATSVWKYLSNK
jgi:aquaporin Z